MVEPILEPQPAKPILASHLLELEEVRRLRFTRYGRPARLSTGCAEIDALLGGEGGGGGVERGIVMGISAEDGDGRLITLNLLASILIPQLSEPSRSSITKASVIDSTGSFPIPTLAAILRSRIIKARAEDKHSRLDLRSEEQGQEPDNVDEDVTRCLAMVGITRVFDVEGLWEVLSEISRSSSTSHTNQVLSTNEDDVETQSTNEAEIADSEEESGEDSTPISKAQTNTFEEGVEIIIIDNMTQIINELLSRKEKSEAHTLLNLLSKSLTTTTLTTNTLTILHNTTVPNTSSNTYTTTTNTSNTSTNISHNQYNFPNPHDHPPRLTRSSHNQPQSQNPQSLFPSTPHKPALGQIFTQFPSLHLFLSKLPQTTRDAEMLYGGSVSDRSSIQDPSPSPIQGKETEKEKEPTSIKFCTVIEILKDETPTSPSINSTKPFAHREGTWCAVTTLHSSNLAFTAAFEIQNDRNENTLAMQKERVQNVLGNQIGLNDAGLGNEGEGERGIAGAERLTGRGVSNVAKIYGFGGRRV